MADTGRPFCRKLQETKMRNLTNEELVYVAGGTGDEEPPEEKKGNNGWGNGVEGTNPGSDEGGTASSKIDEELPGGPGPAKFTTR
jgi:hypothetical protein